MELAPKLGALMTAIDVEVGIGVPMMKDDHEMLRVVYRFNPMTRWGQSLDKMIADDRIVSSSTKQMKLQRFKNHRWSPS